MTETPPFDEGLASFRRFIAEQGFSTNLIWPQRCVGFPEELPSRAEVVRLTERCT